MKKDIPTIYVGYDPREDEPYKVLKHTAEKHASGPLNVYPIKQNLLRRMGLYRRAWQLGSSLLPSPSGNPGSDSFINDIQHRDEIDGRPFSTDFSFSRFLTPFLHRLEGWALFMDCDMYFRSDPLELFEKYQDPKYALYCVKHYHSQAKNEKRKMYGNEQFYYERKNWSSVMMFNCEHEAHKFLTVDDVSTKPGRWLHRMQWLDNYAEYQLGESDSNFLASGEDYIGELSEEWNWLDGHSSADICAKNVHFTRGGPWFWGQIWEPIDQQSEIYAKEWEALAEEIA
jgi:hypothetical protein